MHLSNSGQFISLFFLCQNVFYNHIHSPEKRFRSWALRNCSRMGDGGKKALHPIWRRPKLLLFYCIIFGHLFPLVHLSLVFNQFLLYGTFSYPIKLSRKHWGVYNKVPTQLQSCCCTLPLPFYTQFYDFGLHFTKSDAYIKPLCQSPQIFTTI